MKDRILEKAGVMFLNLGFKSVTMDDIAAELSVSKKTIYKYFSNKLALVDVSVELLHKEVEQKIKLVKNNGFNAIEEEFAIKAIFKEMLKNAKESPMYQLQKYYPEVHKKLMNREECLFKECNADNLNKGIQQGLYRKGIDIDLTMKCYFTLIFAIFNDDSLAHNVTGVFEAEYKVLEYHIRGIATSKGVEELEKQLSIINKNIK